jgi:hypothetical protein
LASCFSQTMAGLASFKSDSHIRYTRESKLRIDGGENRF